MSKVKKATLNLKRPHRMMIRFNGQERKLVKAKIDRAGLSGAEYGRRKMLDLPIVDIVEDDKK